MKTLSQSASFHSKEKTATSKSGIKYLGRMSFDLIEIEGHPRHVRPVIVACCLESAKPGLRQHAPGADQIGATFGDHDLGRIRIAADQPRHYRGIDHPQARDALHAQ